MGQSVHDDLAVDIARELQLEGTCVRVVESIPRQRVIDVSWAAKRAGRLIGRHVRTLVTPLTGRPDGEVAVVVMLEPEHTGSGAVEARRRIVRQRVGGSRTVAG
jgi:hypothetical protein